MNRLTASMSVVLTLLLAACASAPATQSSNEHTAHQHGSEAPTSSSDTGQQHNDAMAQMDGKMHSHMQMMQAQMAKIHATKDPVERQRLMAEHQSAMREHMKNMEGMMDHGSCPMMSAMHEGKEGSKMKGGMMAKGTEQHQCPMMEHMKMMHGMMGQMMEHMAAEHGEQGDQPGASSKKSEEHVH